jgi:hypothetical protein
MVIPRQDVAAFTDVVEAGGVYVGPWMVWADAASPRSPDGLTLRPGKPYSFRKGSRMFKKSLLLLFMVMSPAMSAADAEYWYQVTTKEIHHGEGYRYYGSSPSTLKEIAKAISDKEPVLLNNLIAWDD